MTAPTKSFTTIADSSIDADSPLDETLLTALRDNIEHIKQWLGASFTAAQDHDHDGVNSAAIEIGPNLLRNGSFESGTAGWTVTNYTGGTVVTNTANDMDGATALGFTSTVLANGGGDAIIAAFIACTGSAEILLKWSQKASVANVSSKIEVLWYDDTQSSISTTVVHTTTNTSTTAKKRQRIVVAPSNARYCKVKLTGGIPATGSATGVVYFDGVQVTEPSGALILLDEITGTTASAFDFTDCINSVFSRYVVHLDGMVTSTGTGLLARISTDNGATWISSNNYVTDGGAATNAWTIGTITTSINTPWSGEFYLNNPNDSGAQKIGRAIGSGVTSAVEAHANYYNAGGSVINALRILASGTITGTARIYGVRKGA